MDNSILSCPACRKATTNNLGRLSSINGVIHLPGSSNLYCCSTCGLMFRHPYPSQPDLTDAYSSLPTDRWLYSESRKDFALALEVIHSSSPSGTILDIGCFRGDFLSMLSEDYRKYGVEPAISAREVARRRGINLIGSSIEKIESNLPMFHFITLLDVIEHLPYPLISLQTLAKLLLPGGIIVLSTGNTDVLPWRLMRKEYWYYFTEHVSFFNRHWFRWAASQLDCELVFVKKYSHFNGSAYDRWCQLARSSVYWSIKRCNKNSMLQRLTSSVYPFKWLNRWSSPPKTHLWRDHMLVVMKSKNQKAPYS